MTQNLRSLGAKSSPWLLLRGLVHRSLHVAGIDRAVAYTLAGRGWSVLSGPITLILITRCLTGQEQGYYYTFNNVLGLQVFFELGLTTVILQFASHEKASLSWTQSGTLGGQTRAKFRLASLLRGTLLWYAVAAALAIVVVLPVGLAFFHSHSPGDGKGMSSWQVPWMLFVISSAGALLLSPIMALLQGCGQIEDIVRLQMLQAICGTGLFWAILLAGGGLLGAPAISLTGVVAGCIYLFWRRGRFIRDLLQAPPRNAEQVDWRREVWPFQWRIAVSWLSGYFLFQLFNPVLFAYHGAVVAGQMGMSLNIMSAIGGMAMAVLFTKTPQFGTLIAGRAFADLDRLFWISLRQSLVLLIAGGCLFFSLVLYLNRVNHPISHRMLAPLPLLLLYLTTIINQIVYAQAAYLRAHKQEPFFILSLISGILVGLSTYIFGRYFDVITVLASYLIITLVCGLGGGTYIFLTKRRLWHQEA